MNECDAWVLGAISQACMVPSLRMTPWSIAAWQLYESVRKHVDSGSSFATGELVRLHASHGGVVFDIATMRSLTQLDTGPGPTICHTVTDLFYMAADTTIQTPNLNDKLLEDIRSRNLRRP